MGVSAPSFLFMSALPRRLVRSRFAFDLKCYSKVTFDAGAGDVEDVLDRTLVKPSKQTHEPSGGLLTTKREALHLYRDVLRASNLVQHTNEQGQPWREVLRSSARKEFEAGRFEGDPEMVTRMLVTGRDCLDQFVQKFIAKNEGIKDGVQGGPVRPGV